MSVVTDMMMYEDEIWLQVCLTSLGFSIMWLLFPMQDVGALHVNISVQVYVHGTL